MHVLAVLWFRMQAWVLATFPAPAWAFLLPLEWPLMDPSPCKVRGLLNGSRSVTLSGGKTERTTFLVNYCRSESTMSWRWRGNDPTPTPTLYTSSPCRLEPVFSLRHYFLALLTTARPHSVFQNQLVFSTLAAYFNPRIFTVRPLRVSVWPSLHICPDLQKLRAESCYHKYLPDFPSLVVFVHLKWSRLVTWLQSGFSH